jgi:3-hydroxyisobutyrate dehydrogenase-like beta-hydroxyacid dehydrogenase
MTRVAFLGLGQMGEPMAGRLLEAGHELTVWNRTASRAEPLTERGAAAAKTPAAAAAGAEVAVTMVTGPEALEDVLFGADGLADGLGAGATLIEMSTVGPEPILRAAERLPTGVTMLDAPVLGSVPAVLEGSLKVLAGGEAETFERWRPLLETFGSVTHVGPLGAGASMKLVANSALGAAVVGLGEALALADALGVDRSVALDILSGGALGFAVGRTRASIESGDYPARFKLSLAAKDLRLVERAGADHGLELRLAAAARSWYEDAESAGRGDQDYPAVIPHIREGRSPERGRRTRT